MNNVAESNSNVVSAVPSQSTNAVAKPNGNSVHGRSSGASAVQASRNASGIVCNQNVDGRIARKQDFQRQG